MEKEYGVSDKGLLYQRLAKTGITDEQLLHVFMVVMETCKYCYDGDRGCHCWNDE